MNGIKKEGYEFVGWFVDKELTKRINPGGTLPHAVTLYDKWVPIWYPIEYDCKGGLNSRKNPSYLCIESESLKLFPSKKRNSMFVGWIWKDKMIEELPAHLHEPVHLQAQFKPLPIIEFDTAGGGKIDSICTNEEGYILGLREPNRLGYTFDGWFRDPNYNWRYNFVEPLHESCTLYAHWNLANYKIHYDAQGGMTSRRNPKTYTYFTDTIYLLPATKPGYEFIGWFDVRNNPLNEIRQFSIGDKHLVAHYKKID